MDRGQSDDREHSAKVIYSCLTRTLIFGANKDTVGSGQERTGEVLSQKRSEREAGHQSAFTSGGILLLNSGSLKQKVELQDWTSFRHKGEMI